MTHLLFYFLDLYEISFDISYITIYLYRTHETLLTGLLTLINTIQISFKA